MSKRIKVVPDELTTDNKVNDSQCWDWCIRPLIVLGKLVGVDLSENPPDTSQRRQNLWKIFSFFCLLVNAAYMIFGFLFAFSDLKMFSVSFVGEGGVVSNTFLWNVVIDTLNFIVASILAHLILMFVVRKRWNTLNEAFHRLNIFFDADWKERLRRLSFWGLAYTVSWIGVLSMIGIFSSADTTFVIKLSSFMTVFIQIYPSWTFIMFAIVSYASSTIFKSITLQLNCLKDQGTDDLRNANLSNLKRYYVLACGTVDCIQDCFGWSLLLIIPHHFVAIINAAFYMVGQTGETVATSEILFFMFYLINLFIMTSAADSIRTQSSAVLKELLRIQIDPTDITYRSEVNEFVMQVFMSAPRVNALGFFNVEKKLIPQMIGTVITYYVILRQFHLAENNLPVP